MPFYSCKPITDSSWMLLEDGSIIALVSDIPKRGIVSVIGKLTKKEFCDFTELEQFLGGSLEIMKNEDLIVEEVGDINGFPVKHSEAVAVEHDLGPVYKRSNSSSTLYVAGYYGVKFPNGWVQSYCPKLSTITENEFIGPFTTKLEMLNAISQQKKALDI